jgi:uncharacterized protein (UPF0332 family)
MIQPNENLTKAYLKKAISALNAMNATLQIKETDWTATTAYYARYFALYSLLMKIGIKSEIHDCTIAIAKLLAQKGILNEDLVNDISTSKQIRIDTQYYVERELNKASIKRNATNARKFVLRVEKAIENVTPDQIETIRNHIRNLKRLKSET